MKLSLAILIVSQLANSWKASAFTASTPTRTNNFVQNLFREPTFLSAVPPRGGLSFEEEEDNDVSEASTRRAVQASPAQSNDGSSTAPQDLPKQPSVASATDPFQIRGKLNEIDFCMSPADVSLSRLYSSSSASGNNGGFVSSSTSSTSMSNGQGTRIISLTRASNNASNRAVRRILLSRSWPSPEALNMSLRQVLSAGPSMQPSESKSETEIGTPSKSRSVEFSEEDISIAESDDDGNSAKCPVPRPILNIIVKEQNSNKSRSLNVVTDGKAPEVSSSAPLGRKGTTEEQWVEDQLIAFRDTYGDVEGFKFAEAYLECILSLATSGVESPRISEVLDQGVYGDAYRRIISVLKSAGVIFEGVEDSEVPQMRIAPKLRDQDICLSILDKMNIQNNGSVDVAIPKIIVNEEVVVDGVEDKVEEIKEEIKNIFVPVINKEEMIDSTKSGTKDKAGGLADKLLTWMKKKDGNEIKTESRPFEIKEGNSSEIEGESVEETVAEKEEENIKPEDLGGVLLSKEEPTITRQLNVLSNIVKRTLLFGGDQELLVLSKTLEADRPAFIKQWYPDVSSDDNLDHESRPGVQFFDCLVQLLKDCYSEGIVTSLDPLLPLSQSYANAYERLTALLAELGSGYVKPTSDKKILSQKPQTATEEFIRFSQWEVALRQTKPDVSDFPEDLVGSWQVKDEVGGKIIGTSTVVFKPEGEVVVSPPLTGLKWRLDPGPTHLDTCTFQVLSEDGAILQYRGFLDRGARLESRFSKRSIKIRGAVAFQMRDGDAALVGNDYKRDLLPIDTQPGTTRFVMSKVFDLSDN